MLYSPAHWAAYGLDPVYNKPGIKKDKEVSMGCIEGWLLKGCRAWTSGD